MQKWSKAQVKRWSAPSVSTHLTGKNLQRRRR